MHCKPRFFFNKELVLFVFLICFFFRGGGHFFLSLFILVVYFFFFVFFFKQINQNLWCQFIWPKYFNSVACNSEYYNEVWAFIKKTIHLNSFMHVVIFTPKINMKLDCNSHKNIWFIFHENTIPESNPILFFKKICKVKATFPCTLKLK